VLLGLAAAVAAAVSFGVAAVLQGLATTGTAVRGALDVGLLVRLLRSPVFLGSLAGNLLGFALHVVALQELPLFLAQALVASSVAVTAVLSARVLGERLDRSVAAAVGAVVAGLALLGAAAATGTDDGSHGTLVGVLAVALAAVALAGAAFGRVPAAWTAGVLGLLSGTGYAFVALSARLLPGLTPAALVRSPVPLLLLASALVAILLYVAAMQRGSVTAATAAVVTTQTVVPAVVGLALLGDQVRAGRAPLAVVGFAVAGGGVAVLLRRETASAR
jgi:drug/metabolite transporter (DMT)-like permease